MGFLIWEHPYIVRICPVLWWESWNWCEHQSHLSSGMLPAITLVRSGARNGRTGARASCELGLNPLLSGYHQLIRRRDRSQVSWEKPRQSWPSRCVFFPLLAPVSSPRRGTLLEKEGLVWLLGACPGTGCRNLTWVKDLACFWCVASISASNGWAQMAKNLPAMQETRIQFLSQEEPLEKGMATHFIVLTWRIPWTEEPGRIQPTGLKRVRHMTEQLTLSLSPPFSLFHSIHMQFGVCVAQSNPCPSMELFCEASGWTVCLVQAAAFTRAITDPTTGAIFNPTSLPCFGNKKTCMCFLWTSSGFPQPSC